MYVFGVANEINQFLVAFDASVTFDWRVAGGEKSEECEDKRSGVDDNVQSPTARRCVGARENGGALCRSTGDSDGCDRPQADLACCLSPVMGGWRVHEGQSVA